MEQVFISQPQDPLKISVLRFAAKWAFSHFAIKSELNFEGILGLRVLIYLIKTITIEK